MTEMDALEPVGQEPLLSLQGLGKSYEDFWAARDVTLDVYPGEIYGLLGPNGAGKTTTLRMIAGLLEPSSGDVKVDGRNPRQHPLWSKRRIGFVTGSTGLYQRLTAEELLDFFGQLHELPKAQRKQRVEELIVALGIEDFRKQACGTLSTGQKQRVNIARSLIHDPALLILDEPTSGLDILSADFILQFIRQCKDDGRAVIFSTHILAEIDLLCDRVGVLIKGELVREGSTAELIEATGAQHFAQAFLRIVQDEQERGKGEWS